ncbi:MAG: hypothetical protein P0Y56_03295 [Candidatus Andeanibacterium colombiense]|uniref:Uncharacterized protein n=1 Tax=Candidatus Andeanibacterium colombiense TaxID=3121345 RepID=A0AAJ5X7A6_9SPHN|nr:MAG: hypothetical protein P0Y56_03295 [Sphingomonadaceae bacterium]
MNSLSAFLAPLALLLPAGIADAPGLTPASDSARLVSDVADSAADPLSLGPESATSVRPLSDAMRPGENAQVRIEQSITIRIAARPPRSEQDLLRSLPQGSRPTAHFEERKVGSCVAAQGIVGVQTRDDNKLLLFMRDRRILTAALEKACSSRDFYSGFYIERSDDGQLCTKRDKIHSRSGSKCELKQFRQLVAVRD